MEHPLRPMLDAVRYVVRNGIEWRAMPVDFLIVTWQAVYAFHDRWSRRDLPQRLCHRLRERLCRHGGRDVQPTAAIVDSQSVKSAEWAHPLEVGFDANKRLMGIKRHLVVDVEGFLLAVVVTAACIDDRLGLKLLLIRLLNSFTKLKVLWADAGYSGAPLASWVKAVAGITLEVIARPVPHVAFSAAAVIGHAAHNEPVNALQVRGIRHPITLHVEADQTVLPGQPIALHRG
jgi:transposase